MIVYPEAKEDKEDEECRVAMEEAAHILRAVEGDARPLALVIQEVLLGGVEEQHRPRILQMLLDGASDRMDRIVQQSMRRHANGQALWPLRVVPEA